MNTLHPATFWFDGAREHVRGWTDGSTWNNWGVPLFDEQQLPAAIRALKEAGLHVTRRGATLRLKHKDDNYETNYIEETIGGKHYWRLEGLTWNYEPIAARGKRAREADDDEDDPDFWLPPEDIRARKRDQLRARIEAVVRLASTLTYMGAQIEGDVVRLSTRANGDVGDETPGKEDIAEGRRVARELRKAFPEARVELETVDEWVDVTVDLTAGEQPMRERSSRQFIARASSTRYEILVRVPSRGLKNVLEFDGEADLYGYLQHLLQEVSDQFEEPLEEAVDLMADLQEPFDERVVEAVLALADEDVYAQYEFLGAR